MCRFFTLLILISLSVGMLYGATGLYGLVFAEALETAGAKLEAQGFAIQKQLPGRVIFHPDNQSVVQGIELRYDEESLELTGWSVAYRAIEEDNMDDLVVGALISRHGTDFMLNSDGSFGWDLGPGQFVLAGWDFYQRLFVVDYRLKSSAQ